MPPVANPAETSSEDVAKLHFQGKEVDLPICVGTENEQAVDISQLRKATRMITLDPGYVNTGATESAITFLDGDKGELRYRGYPIEQLAAHCDFVEVCYLLIYGDLPNADQLEVFRQSIRNHTMLHEDIRSFYNGFPRDAHPMAILSSVVSACRPSTRIHSIQRTRDRSMCWYTACWPSCRPLRLIATRNRLASR